MSDLILPLIALVIFMGMIGMWFGSAPKKKENRDSALLCWTLYGLLSLPRIVFFLAVCLIAAAAAKFLIQK